MKFPRWLSRGVAWLDYGHIVPLLARLPRWLAWPFVVLRGCVNYAFDFDWRTLALGHGYVRRATLDAMSRLNALSDSGQSARFLALRRYVCASREEVDCWRLLQINYDRVSHQIEGLEPLLTAQSRGQGVVLLTAHFDSLYIGLALLARAGLHVNVMATRITSDPRVPPAISQHFAHKVQALNTLLAPGKAAYFEDNMRFFIRALQRGDVVLMACDGVSTSEDRTDPVAFLGGMHLMASGPQFLAERAGAPIALFSCYEDDHGVFRISISEPKSLVDGGLQRAFSILETQVLATPWRWWGADQMRSYVQAPEEAASITQERP